MGELRQVQARLSAALLLLAAVSMLGCSAPMYQARHTQLECADALSMSVQSTTMPAIVYATPRARFEAAWSTTADGQFSFAARAWEAWLEEFARMDEPLTPRAMFWLGFSREQLGQYNQARDAYQQLARRFPSAPATRLASTRAEQLPG